MKKLLSVLLVLCFSFSFVGCVNEGMPVKDFKKLHSYDNFVLYSVEILKTEQGNAKNWTFNIISSDEFIFDSAVLSIDETVKSQIYKFEISQWVYRFECLDKSINRNGDNIKVDDIFFIDILYAQDFTLESLPITLTYTKTDGETVSKDYILDFTQKSIQMYVYEYPLNPNWKCICGSGKKLKDCCINNIVKPLQ